MVEISIERIKAQLKPQVNIEKEVAVQFDGKQYMIKLPKEITDFYDLKKGDRIRFTVEPKARGEGSNSFRVIKR